MGLHGAHGHGNTHGPDRSRDARALAAVLGLTALFAVVEVVGGLLADSLALLADAAHMLSDGASLALALGAIWLAQRPAPARLSFGYRRAEILAALANGVVLVAVAIWIIVEGVGRLSSPPDVNGTVTLAIGLAGLAVNTVGATILRRAGSQSLNMRAATLHVFADLLGSAGVVVAAILVLSRAGCAPTRSSRSRSGRWCWPARGACCGSRSRCCSRAPRRGSTPRPWAGAWRPRRACARSTTCTSGPSPPGSRPCRRTSWWARGGLPRPSPRAVADARRRVRPSAHHAPGGAQRRGGAPPRGVGAGPQPARRPVRYMTTTPARKPPTTQPEASPPGARRAR